MGLRYFNPLAWGRWSGQFLHAWALSISWQDVSKAIPALILVTMLGVTGVIAWSDTSDWRSRLMERQLDAAWERDDFETAELIIRRQLASKPDDSKTVYNLALTLSAQGNHDRALELTRQLVKFRNDFDSARWLLAREYIGKDWSLLNDDQRDEFGQLLEVIQRKDKNDLKTRMMYADYLIATKQYAKAVPVLDDLSNVQPMRGLQAAAISRSLGNDTDADIFARRCLDAVSKMSEEDPANSGLALSVAQNQLFLKRYSQAIETLYRAIEKAKDPEELTLLEQALGDGVVAWIEQIESSPSNTNRQRVRVLKLLQLAVNVAPQNPRVMALVADQVLANARNSDEEIVVLREALIEGSAPGLAHFIQGTAALVNDDVDEATLQLKLASEMMPNSSAILNNLAVALSARGDDQLEEALKLANAALENLDQPAPHFYETRGQILYRLGRHLEAVADLERAVSHPDLAHEVHKSLADCYAALGKPEWSRDHREAAKKTANREQP